MKAVVVTGVSTGIGEGLARYLANRGYTVFGSVRALKDADRLHAELGTQFVPLVFDVTDPDAIRVAAEQVAEQVGDHGLRGLINNAGIAVTGPLMHLDLDRIRTQFEVNVIGALAVTQQFLPLLGARPAPPHAPGRIVNISSVSTSVVLPFVAPYAASKQALEGMSDGLRRELQVYGIDVVVVAPGVVSTPIWDKLEADRPDVASVGTAFESAAARSYAKTKQMGQQGMPMSKLCGVVRRALELDRPRVRYVVSNRRMPLYRLIPWIPARWLDRIIARRLDLLPPEA